jgi:rod shape-determining protein MreC
MRNLLRLIIRYHNIILFIILEVIAFMMLARFSSYQRARIFRLKHALIGNIEERYENISAYFSLARENKSLAEENIHLYNSLPASYFNPLSSGLTDTSSDRRYVFMGARVINNSTNKQYNFIILDQGSRHGVEPNMAVICSDGLVGMVKETTENFSSVISLLNREFHPNAMIKRNGYFGYIDWPGRHYKRVILKEIPLHADVRIGDTIITSGYSSIFPKGILIGTVEKFEPEEGIFYNITVDLSTDFKRLAHVTLIKNLMREEQIEIEERAEND